MVQLTLGEGICAKTHSDIANTPLQTAGGLADSARMSRSFENAGAA